MLRIMIPALFVLMEGINCGYINHRPNIEFYLPKINPDYQGEIQRTTTPDFIPKQTIQSVVSYSLPFQSQNNLHQHDDNFRSDGINLSKVIGTAAPLSTINQRNNLAYNLLSLHGIPAISTPTVKLTAPVINQQSILTAHTREHVNIPINHNFNLAENVYSHFNIPSIPTDITPDSIPYVNYLAPIKQQSDSEFNALNINIPESDIPSVNVPASVQLQSNLEFTKEQHVIRQDEKSFKASINAQKVVSPLIMKDIYFHVPPPEIEESSLRTIAPRKKNYKIIFIKVPSQETGNSATLQGSPFNQVAPIEEKTIIYVLSKKPMTEKVLPKPVPSEHEVFFIKYNGDLGSAVQKISDNLEQRLEKTVKCG